AVGIADADAVLAAGGRGAVAGVDAREQFPAAIRRGVRSLRFRLEAVGRTVAAIHHVDLRSAGAGMPRVGIDLPDDTVAAEIDPQASAVGVLREEKIFLRLIVP